MGTVLSVIQTLAIVITLSFSMWQWNKTRNTIKIDNYAKIIAAMNSLRDYRLDHPELEKALFENRADWSDDEIRKHVYGVMFANIFEWTYFSYKEHLIDETQWKAWETTVKDVILDDPGFSKLLCDRSVYTFSFEAFELISKWVREAKE